MKTIITILLFVLIAWTPLSAQDFEWVKSFGGLDHDNGNALCIDSSGNIYTGGIFNATADFDPGQGTYNLTSAGGQDIFIQKMDSAGNFLWARAISGSNDDFFSRISVDNSGNVYTTGYFQDTLDADPGQGNFDLNSAGSNDIFVQKMDTNGNFLWAFSIGGTGDDRVYDLKIDSSGNLYIIGVFGDTMDFDPGPGTYNLTANSYYNAFVLKTDNNGNFIWARTFGGANYIDAWSIDIDNTGNIYIAGDFDGTADFDPGTGTFNLTSTGEYDVYVLKLDSAGNFIWAKSFGGPDYDNGWSIRVDTNGNIYTTGDFSATADFDPGTGTYNLTPVGHYDVFVQKMDTNGNFLWAKSFGSNNWDQGITIEVDVNGDVYTYGIFSDTTDFDPGTGTFNLTPVNGSDTFVQKMDSTGNFQWAISWSGSYFGYGNALHVDETGNIFITGNFAVTTDFDPGPSEYNLDTSGGNDVFVLKLSQSGFVTKDNITEKYSKLFPNPAHNKINVDLSDNYQSGLIKICDISGKIVYQENFYRKKILIIPLSTFSSGIYFAKLLTGNKQATFRFIKN